MESSTEGWLKGVKVRVEEGIIKTSSNELLNQQNYSNLVYNPFDHPNLPTALAKVSDEKSAIRFVEDWGLLGYSQLIHPRDRLGGDPLKWVLGHAKSVKFVLQLIMFLSPEYQYFGDDDKLIELLKTGSLQQKFFFDSGSISGCYALAHGVSLRGEWTTRQNLLNVDDEHFIKGFACSLIASCVNNNTENVKRLLEERNGTLISWLRCNSLIEVVWYLVGELAFKAQEDGKKIRECEKCHTPFVVTDGRQRFCPPPQGYTKSRCGNQQRVAAKRTKDRQLTSRLDSLSHQH